MARPDANKTPTEIILDHAWDTWEARQGKRRASWPAWVGFVLSAAVVIFTAGVLRGDVASANDRSIKNETRIETLENERAAIARIEAKVDILMEDRGK